MKKVYDAQLNPLKTLAVGRTPQNLCTDGQKLYVVNTTSDDISVVDTKQDTVVSKIVVRHNGFRFGSSPTSCAVAGNRLYVTQAEINAVAVIDTSQIRHYIKRGGVVSDRYDQLSLLRTVELVLGLDPINLNDALAVPMFGIFTDKPNNSVYVAPTPSNYLMKTDKDLYQKVK